MPVIRTLVVFLPAAVIITLLDSTPFIVQHALATPISVPSSSGSRLASLSVRTNRSPAPRYLVSHATVAVTTKSPRALSRITAGDTEHKASRSVPHSPRELDRTNDLEVLLKNIVNADKDVLTVTYDLVDSLPVIGPILGPIVYEIKCIVDDLLDIVENLSDATIKRDPIPSPGRSRQGYYGDMQIGRPGRRPLHTNDAG